MEHDRRLAGLSSRVDLYRKQKNGDCSDHFGVAGARAKSLPSSDFGSDSSYATVYVQRSITKKRPGGFLVSFKNERGSHAESIYAVIQTAKLQ